MFTFVFRSTCCSGSPHREIVCKDEPPEEIDYADSQNDKVPLFEEFNVEEKPFTSFALLTDCEKRISDSPNCSQDERASLLVNFDE